MKRDRARGMRDIPTVQGLRNRSTPETRQQAVTEWARLEHEKARLEREMETWISNQKKTEERLKQVNERRARLQEMLGVTGDESPTTGRPSRRPATRDSAENRTQSGSWQEVSLEY
jgi:predicted nuclease with TOPRIM domain